MMAEAATYAEFSRCRDLSGYIFGDDRVLGVKPGSVGYIIG